MLVFVSYCLQDVALVKPLILQLGVLGHNVQFESKMPGGHIRWTQVMNSIKSSDVFIVALTDHALLSDSRRLEIQYARRLGKRAMAVRLSDVTGEIPSDLAPIMDYIEPDKQTNLQLAQTLNKVAMIGLVPADVTVPDWRIPILKMQTTIKTPDLSLSEQETIVSNLQEFLERIETRRAARSLLKTFARRQDLDPTVQDAIQLTSTQLKQTYTTQRRARLRNMAMVGMVVLMILTVPVFLVYRKSRNDASAATAQFEATQTFMVTSGTSTGAPQAINTPDASLVFTDVPVITVATVTPTVPTVAPDVSPTVRPTLTPTLVPPAVFTIPDLATATRPSSLDTQATATRPSSLGAQVSPTSPVFDANALSD